MIERQIASPNPMPFGMAMSAFGQKRRIGKLRAKLEKPKKRRH
jgi:hypothetical protein